MSGAKCPVCGSVHGSVQAFKDHYRAKHGMEPGPVEIDRAMRDGFGT